MGFMGGEDLGEDVGGLIDGQGVVAFVFEPMGDGGGDLVGDFFGVGPGDVAILFAVPEVEGDGDVREAEIPGVEVDIGVSDEAAGAIADGVAEAEGHGVEVAGVLEGGLIAGGEETNEVAEGEVVLVFGCEFGTEAQDEAEGDGADFSKADEKTIDPEEIPGAEFTDGRGAADDLGAEQALGDEGGADEGVGTATGDADDVEFFPTEVVGEFFDDRGPVEELAFGMVVGEAETGAVGADESDALFEGGFVHGPGVETRARPAVEVEGGDALGIAEFGVA